MIFTAVTKLTLKHIFYSNFKNILLCRKTNKQKQSVVYNDKIVGDIGSFEKLCSFSKQSVVLSCYFLLLQIRSDFE